MSEFTLEGLQELLANFERLGGNSAEAIAPSLKEEAEAIMTDSKQNYVPVDQGILQSSGYVNDPETHGDSIEVELGFGGAAKDYAIVQHERLDFNHPHQGGAKYLERPMMAAERGMPERLGQRIWAEIGRLIR